MFILQSKIPYDIWVEIRSFIVHDIKTHGKHLKRDKNVICYNNVLKTMPRFCPSPNPQIVFNRREKSFHTVKYLYNVVHKNKKRTIITFCPILSHNGMYIYHKNDYISYYKRDGVMA